MTKPLQKGKVSSNPPKAPADPPVPAPPVDPKPNPTAAAPAVAKDKPKAKSEAPKREGPGRPPGAPNKPKAGAGEVPRAARVAGDEVKDTKAYMKRLEDDAKKCAEKHNRLHPGDKMQVQILYEAELKVQMTPIQCEGLARAGCDMLGKRWKVETRPEPTAIGDWGKAASEMSRYLPLIPPIYICAVALIFSSFALVGPMMDERNRNAVAKRMPPKADGETESAR